MADASESRNGAQAISNAMTKLHRDHYGRGPETVRTVVGHDHAICFLESMSTQVERTLIDGGEQEAVKEMRLAFQRTMEPRFVETVEGILGRKVRAFLSQVTFDPDLSVEIFVLERDNADPAPEGVG
jgi:uncharacterized protein YbcI